ncbi:MAG TPA: PAS-domain containing protein [Rhizomicrobium sp.]
MHEFFDILFGAYVRLVDATSQLADIMAGLLHRAAQPGELALASIVVASLLLGVFASIWALVERARAAAGRYVMAGTLARAQSEIRFREALIQAVPDAIVLMGSDLSAPLSYRGGSALLRACLTGADSTRLAAALDALMTGGSAFALAVRTAQHVAVSVHGCVVGSRAAVFLRTQGGSAGLEDGFKAVAEALPAPVWIRDGRLHLLWANRAFLAATGAPTLEDALGADTLLMPAERDLAAAALEGNDVFAERRYAVIGGRRRALSIDMLRLDGGKVVGIALDVTDAAQAEAQLRLAADAQADVLDHAGNAVAVFGPDRRLGAFNKAFPALWDLDESWLEQHPTLDDIFDRLRETRRLPEQRDFQAWKRDHLRLFESQSGRLDETWHVAGGVSVRVSAHPYLLGGVYYVFDDIGELLRLNTALHMLRQTERATLDAVENAMAVFGPDGRLKMHNSAFAALWRMTEDELAAAPHLSAVAEACAARIGRDNVWSTIASAVTAVESSSHGEWGRQIRADGRVLSVSLTRLPLGATLVMFDDLTDLERFIAATHAGAAA